MLAEPDALPGTQVELPIRDGDGQAGSKQDRLDMCRLGGNVQQRQSTARSWHGPVLLQSLTGKGAGCGEFQASRYRPVAKGMAALADWNAQRRSNKREQGKLRPEVLNLPVVIQIQQSVVECPIAVVQ